VYNTACFSLRYRRHSTSLWLCTCSTLFVFTLKDSDGYWFLGLFFGALYTVSGRRAACVYKCPFYVAETATHHEFSGVYTSHPSFVYIECADGGEVLGRFSYGVYTYS
jgi:hypothetical protein